MDPPRERAGYVNLQAPRISYGPRAGLVARREKRELDRPWVVQNSGQVYPIFRRNRTNFSTPPQPIVTLVPNVGSLGEHRVAVAAEPLRAWGSNVAWRQKTLLVVPGELTVRRTNPHPAVKVVGCAKGSTTKVGWQGRRPADGDVTPCGVARRLILLLSLPIGM